MNNHTPTHSAALPFILIGAGRVGQSLALLAHDLKIPVRALWNRSPEASQAAQKLLASTDVSPNTSPTKFFHGPLAQQTELHQLVSQPAAVWLTVRDDAIATTARELAPFIHPQSLVFHTSGSLNSTLLKDAQIRASAASLHPLQAITDPHRARQRFADSFWTLEGDPAASLFATALLAQIDVDPIVIHPEQKILYHAAANTTANLLTALLDTATAMATAAGIPPDQAQTMLINLARSSIENLSTQSFSNALSGPVARGDNDTIHHHERAIAALNDPTMLQIYRLLTDRARKLK